MSCDCSKNTYFKPEEVIFAPTSLCNLNCAHCTVTRKERSLSTKYALRFLKDCKKHGIEWLGFSGGEPFLVPTFLEKMIAEGIEQEMFFDRIMTNAVWFRNKSQLDETLDKLYNIGFDGRFCVSVDAFHKQDIKKVAQFMRAAIAKWKRNDCVQIASVAGLCMKETIDKLSTLAGFLGAKLIQDDEGLYAIAKEHKLISIEEIKEGYDSALAKDLYIEISSIELSPVEEVRDLKDPWGDEQWFEDDYCAGPGNVLYVHSDGCVAACCGYANESDGLILGNIRKDSVSRLIRRAHDNPVLKSVYSTGLATVRKRMEEHGYEFPGKTKNHCFFCWYILNKIPQDTLQKVIL